MKFKEIIKENWLLILILVIALLVRLHNLGFLSIWVDEFIHVQAAKEFIQGTFKGSADAGNGILLTYSIIPFFKLFGINDFLARFPSVIYAILSLFLFFKIAKKLFNTPVAYIGLILLTFSQYHVFWSRIARNYAIFGFFFLLLIYLILKFMDPKEEDIKTSLFKKINISEKYLVLFIIALVFSLLSHPLTFFVFFGFGFYCFLVFIANLFDKKNKSFKDKYAVLAYLFVAGSILVFLPALSDTIKSILGVLLPAKVVNWVVPDWARLSTLAETAKHSTFDLYMAVLKSDFNMLYYLGFIGFVAQFFINKRSALFSLAMFGYLFILMSYVYREPALPRYLYYIYPFFVMAIASTLFLVYDKLLKKVVPEKIYGSKVFIGALLLAIIALTPIKDTVAMLQSEKHGQVIPRELSHWYFTNWKQASLPIKNEIKESDVIITTGRMNVGYYLDRNDAIRYRQVFYNTETRQYENFKDKDFEYPHAYTYNGVKEIYDRNERGWMVTDYYFDGIFSDPKTRDFLVRNTIYRSDLSNSDIKVLQWDKSKPKTQNNTMLEVLTADKKQSKEFFVNIAQLNTPSKNIVIEAEGLDNKNELKVILNRKSAVYIDVSKGNKYAGNRANSLKRQVFTIPINSSVLVPGRNSIIFQFGDNVGKERFEGAVVYNISIQ